MIAFQIAGICLGLAILAFYPPVDGRILLIPIGRQAEARLIPLAVDAGARLIGRGPWSASYVVYGERGRLSAALHDMPVLMIAAAPGCGPGRRG